MSIARFAAIIALSAVLIAAPGAARADYSLALLTLTDDPAASGSSPGTLHYGLDYSLSGTAHVSQAIPYQLAGHTATLSLDATITFALGPVAFVGADGSVGYDPGGSVSIVGSVNGGPSETILRSLFMTGGEIRPNWVDTTLFAAQGFIFGGELAPDIAGRFGVDTLVLGDLGFVFRPTDAVDYALAGDHVGVQATVSPAAGTVPEPASLAMVGVGVVMVGAWRGRNWRQRVAVAHGGRRVA